VRGPAGATAERERVAVEQDDPGRLARLLDRLLDRDPRAERMPDELGSHDPELLLEAT
jgi:hypothetical protein